jgi:hypothetical protein
VIKLDWKGANLKLLPTFPQVNYLLSALLQNDAEQCIITASTCFRRSKLREQMIYISLLLNTMTSRFIINSPGTPHATTPGSCNNNQILHKKKESHKHNNQYAAPRTACLHRCIDQFGL